MLRHMRATTSLHSRGVSEADTTTECGILATMPAAHMHVQPSDTNMLEEFLIPV